jgi:hypothetical protein
MPQTDSTGVEASNNVAPVSFDLLRREQHRLVPRIGYFRGCQRNIPGFRVRAKRHRCESYYRIETVGAPIDGGTVLAEGTLQADNATGGLLGAFQFDSTMAGVTIRAGSAISCPVAKAMWPVFGGRRRSERPNRVWQATD